MKTSFSKTLERKGRWDTGLKFERTDGSRLGFLINGLTTACLITVGTDPELRLVLKKREKTWSNCTKNLFKHFRWNNVQGTVGSSQLLDNI